MYIVACDLVRTVYEPIVGIFQYAFGKENMKNDIANGNKDLYPLWPAIDIHRSVFPAYASSLIGEEKVCASNNKKQQKLQYLNSHLIEYMCQRFC